MKLKSIVTALLAAGTFGASAYTAAEHRLEPVQVDKVSSSAMYKANSLSPVKARVKTYQDQLVQNEYLDKNYHDGEKLYIVRLVGDSVPVYKGGIAGYDAVYKGVKQGVNQQKFNAKSDSAVKYASYLDKKQTDFINKASTKLGGKLPDLKRYKYAINGFLTKLTHAQAKTLAGMPEVAFLEQNTLHYLDTDTGPEFIGAGAVWDGSATGTAYQGEGTILGIFDTGVNTDHPSFAATGDDGYTVVNPWGDDVYVGDCETDASLCNSKLIGVRSYPELLDFIEDAGFTRPANGEDYNGHGSHTAGTSGGNVLNDVPLIIADPAAGETGDGIATSTIFSRLSGVAPHANIISYQTCLPGNTGDTAVGCFSAAGIGAIDDAIADGVDVINYSVGRSGAQYNPWLDSTEVGFLSASAAGVFVATSAGNSGPDAFTTTKSAPWYTAVAASTHDRTVSNPLDFNGTNYDFQIGTGPALPSGGITAPVIDSGSVDAANIEGCNAFAANSFDNSIALISRGSCAFVDKINNAANAGALAAIIYNNAGDGLISMLADGTTIPGVFVGQTDGEAMVAALTATPGLTATIDSENFVIGTGTGDVLASFSSRGPTEAGQIIAPQIAAPGVNIYAAYADEHFYRDVTTPRPRDFAFLGGTSMASPHIAGSAALLMQAHPTWNPDQVRSALMMTATSAMLKEDGVTPADVFDMGSGRVQVDLAINAGLVMSETEANYLAGDPNNGGDVKALNIPSMANYGCGLTCTWTRTFTAVTDASFTLATDDPALTVSPATIDAVAGTDYTVTVTMDTTGMADGDQLFGNLNITAAGLPDLHLPVYVAVNRGSVPADFTITAGRNDASYEVHGLESFSTPNLTFTLDGLYDANATGLTESLDFDLAEDPTNGEPFDDFSQLYGYEFVVSSGTAAINIDITATTAADLDVFLLIDGDDNGTYESVVAAAQTAAALETISVATPPAGNYAVYVQNWQGSGAATDSVSMDVEVVPLSDPIAGLTIDAPTSASGLAPIDATLIWDLDMSPGDAYFADITMAGDGVDIGTFRVTLVRGNDDFSGTAAQTLVARGDVIDYTITVNPSTYNLDQELDISVDMPENLTLVPGSVSVTGGNVTLKDPNAVGLNIVENFDIAVDPTNGDPFDDLSQVFVHDFMIPAGSLSMEAVISNATAPDFDLFVLIDADGNGTYETVVGQGTTPGANEIVELDNPVEGAYRVVVQNWAGSGAATDTGTVTITTVPATGEGFFWDLDLLAPFPSYNVVSSATDATCAAAGFGGYFDTSGFSTAGISGDETTWAAYAGWSFPHFGGGSDGLLFNSNGFLMFSGDAGPNAWFNQPIPNAAAPNDMLAGLWKDQIVEDDGTRGIRLLSISSIGMAFISYDGSESWTPAGDSTDRFNYQFMVFDNISDDHAGYGPYEMIVAYSPTQVGSLAGATAGAENADGTHGIDASSMIAAGTQICYDAVDFAEGYTVTFSVVPESNFAGQTAAPMVTIDSDLEGTSTIDLAADAVELVNVAPIADAGPDETFDRADVDRVKLSAFRTIDYDTDKLSFTWEQINGEPVTLSTPFGFQTFFDVADVENGSFTFEVTVTDGEFTSTDQVTVTVEGVATSGESDGIGSMGWLLLLGIPMFLRRRSPR